MFHENEIALAEEAWRQAKESLSLADTSWQRLMESEESLRNSLEAKGASPSEAISHFEALMAEHARVFSATAKHVLNVEAIYRDMLVRVRQRSGKA